MASTTADATAPETPSHGVDSGPELDATPLVIGSTAVWPEEECEGERTILEKVHEIAKGDKRESVNHHVPEMIWSHKFEDTSTANIKMALELKDAERGRRVLNIIVFRKLCPITKLSGRKFLSAWWHIVVCHYTLWEQNVHHRNVNPNNLIVYKTSDGRYIGVLKDFDLSSTRDSPSGQKRIGTAPFMAIELLMKKSIEGKIKHVYWHDAESFIWVLAWVCLRYQKGKLLNKGRQLDEWLQGSATRCRMKKFDFMIEDRHTIKPSPSHQRSWKVAQSCLRLVGLFYYVNNPKPSLENAFVFETWLQENVRHRLSPDLLDIHV